MNRHCRNSIQEWLPLEKVLENGIIKLKNQRYIKIISVCPINYNLKSELEKEAIVHSYKLFLKTCNFDMQFVIQSNKEDYGQYFSYLQQQAKKENKTIQKIQEKYCQSIKKLSSIRQSSNKKFFLIIATSELTGKSENNDREATEELNEKYHKIKECLARCGNDVSDYSSKLQVHLILESFLIKKITQ